MDTVTVILMDTVIAVALNKKGGDYVSFRIVNASSEPITGSQVSAGNRYIAYFNKCDNVIQLMNYTPAPAA